MFLLLDIVLLEQDVEAGQAMMKMRVRIQDFIVLHVKEYFSHYAPLFLPTVKLSVKLNKIKFDVIRKKLKFCGIMLSC